MIFISYSREDRVWAERVTSMLRVRGRHVVRDPVLVEGDPFWRDTVRQILENSRVVLVLWSKYAARSPWVDQEVRAFQAKGRFLCLDETPLPGRPEQEQDLDAGMTSWMKVGEAPAIGDLTVIAKLLCGNVLQKQEVYVQPEYSDRDCDDEAASVHRRRMECLAAQEARLARFRREAGTRFGAITRSADGTLIGVDGSRLLRVPGGCGGGSEAHVYMSATPVTNGQYRIFIDETGYPPPPAWQGPAFRLPDTPVVGVSWFEAMAYAAWVGGELPTQQEWRRAASGGNPRVEYATWNGRLSRCTAHFGNPFGVGAPQVSCAYRPNSSGFYGMCGNTWDWCSTHDGPHHVICGGGYMDSAPFCRVMASYRNAPLDRDCCVGFRIKLVSRKVPQGE
jgi:sulfatase-modifying factor enzyme 1/TIR domain-containing protein